MSLEINHGWELTATPPNAYGDPNALQAVIQPWQKAIVPGTVAQSVAGNSRSADTRFDALDWWYRCSFSGDQKKYHLRFEGLATLTDIWLNGIHILSTDNMFRTYFITSLLKPENTLIICFRSLEAALQQKRPRPRWKTKLVDQQCLRWFRTTLLGRIPGWTPNVAPVGPWKGIYKEEIPKIDIVSLDIQTWAESGVGTLRLAATVRAEDFLTLQNQDQTASLRVGQMTYPIRIAEDAGGHLLSGEIIIPDVPLWWPHTHGKPTLLDCSLQIKIGEQVLQIDCGKVGFKEVDIDRTLGHVQMRIHGTPVFCRGACWTTNDFISLTGSRDELKKSLLLARDAGLNMLRIGGTMVYETELFYNLCNELGIMVWQDFMFANMDYPVTDTAFNQNIQQEASFQLSRLQKHPCITVYCGSSEVAQQAAMMGLPEECWSNAFFSETLPGLCEKYHKGIPYFPSSPCEGALPFHIGTGISHYYGVGAYRRPITDVKQAKVRFTSECLGFSNVPETHNIDLIMGGRKPATHHPLWKMGVPRDTDAGWDFEDIRDYYMEHLFNVDAVALRSQDMEAYLFLSRATTGEVMKQVYAEWRRPNSDCGGGLIWLFKDISPGAGWGIIDSENRPKAVYYYLKRAWAPQAILITDEGLDGLNLHVINDRDFILSVEITIEIFQEGKTLLASARQSLKVKVHSATTLSSDAMLKHFSDITNVYRFGPSKHDLVVARLIEANTGIVISEDFYFPQGFRFPYITSVRLTTHREVETDGSIVLTLESDCFLQTVHLEAKGYEAYEDYFHLAPKQAKKIRFSPLPNTTQTFRPYLTALNIRDFIAL
jgi:beta-mannosidase